jgi:D-3-phosphoglycerate dehydrogenase
VGSDIGHPDAYLLRSHKLHDVEVPASLVAVARAGAGVNNIPVADYSKRASWCSTRRAPTPTPSRNW